eukprot:696508_1
MDWSKVHWEMDEDEEKDIVLLEETPTTKPTDSVPVIKAPVPRPRKRKINPNADSHLPPRKKNKHMNKKVTKKTETSSAKGDIEDQFFAIPKSQQIMILQNTHHEEWETMVEAVGINDVEQLKYLLNRETIWDMEITKQDLIIALDETGQSINKKLRPYWKINTISFYLIKKRMLLLQMNRHKDHQGNHQSICKVYKQAHIGIRNIHNKLNEKMVQRKQGKVCGSINEIIDTLNKTRNKTRNLNQLCDYVLVLRELLKGFIAELIGLESTLDYALEFSLKIMKRSGDKRVHLQNKTLFGNKTLKAPGVWNQMMGMVNHVVKLRDTLQQKLDVCLEYDKIAEEEALNQRQTATETARKKDAKRKETSGNNNNNSNSNAL